MQDIDLDSLARGYTTACVAALGAWATAKPMNRDNPSEGGVDPDIKIRAIGMLLDRGWGRPKQTHDATVQGELNINIRKLLGEDE